MTDAERERFDGLLEEALQTLPPALHALLDDAPLIVDDEPEDELARSLVIEAGDEPTAENVRTLKDELCGLHSGFMLTERSVENPTAPPETIHLFRAGIVRHAGGWAGELLDEPAVDESGEPLSGDDLVYEQIMVTLLHEIGHHFGLDEDDLDRLGYA
jgi:predicted Zn-dependent protease with MMP-like domain